MTDRNFVYLLSQINEIVKEHGSLLFCEYIENLTIYQIICCDTITKIK